jgi:hypothetical protein
VAITRSHRVLGRKSRYRPRAYGKTLPRILDLLSDPEMAFVEQVVGYRTPFANRNSQTVIKAGKRLLSRIEEHGIALDDLGVSDDEEAIILKRTKEDFWDEGGLEEYDDNSTTRTYRAEVNRINAWLADADIQFDDDVLNDAGNTVDVTDRKMRRVFTRSSFASGGRLFGGFWQAIGKKQRKEGLVISCEDVVTLDFRQMAPRILYGLAGVAPGIDDLYAIPGLEACRPGVKKVMNAILFADHRLSRFPKGTVDLFPKRQSFNGVVTAIEETHPAIKDRFFMGLGHKAQFIESEILIDILLALMDEEIIALPIHDAVIVPRCRVPRVRTIMVDTFHQHTGIDGMVEEEQ